MVLKEKLTVHTKHRLYLITQGNTGYIDFCIQMIIIQRKPALLNIMGSYAEYNLPLFLLSFFSAYFYRLTLNLCSAILFGRTLRQIKQ